MKIRLVGFFGFGWLMTWAAVSVSAFTLEADDQRRWYKGNTHTHTLWSDGDAAPEIAVAWYRDNGYDFLCLSDHNVISDGSSEKWQPIAADGLLTEEKVDQIRKRFGDDWVQVGKSEEGSFMKLKTLPEIKAHFETGGDFLLIQAEEVTSFFPPVHVNVLNLRRVIPPVNSTPHVDALASALAVMNAQSEELGIPMLAHLNHPNWSDGVPVETLLGVNDLEVFEVYNGHPDVRNWGSEERGMHPTDRIWDIVLAMRLRESGRNLLYGFATDDSHAYFERRIGKSNTGRGWIQVLAEDLSAESLIGAMKAGQFYSSSGVELRSVRFENNTLTLDIAAEAGVGYKTQFIATRKSFDPASEPVLDEQGNPKAGVSRRYSESIGEVLFETEDNPSTYTLKGDELYIRAKIVSTKLQDNPHQEGDFETAWVQPVIPE